jgi:demethylspheroidene O-methyltransferase
VLADAKFQRWAAKFPLTRLVAERRASAVFDLCAGFVYSQVLYAVVNLGVLEAVAGGPRTLDELTGLLELPESSARRLVDAAVSLRLLEAHGSGYGLGALGAALLANEPVLAMIRHHALLYRDLADPVRLLREQGTATEVRRFWPYADPSSTEESQPNVAHYTELMALTSSLFTPDIFEAYPLRKHRRLLDVCGGSGSFLIGAGRVVPHLSLVLFELPNVAKLARARIADAGMSARTTVVPGDIFRDSLPRGADLISLVRVIHDHNDEEAVQILRKVRDALEPGGTLLLAEPLAGTHGAEPMGDAYFGFYLLAMGQGQPRKRDQLYGLLDAAGFRHFSSRKTRRPILTGLIVARVRK